MNIFNDIIGWFTGIGNDITKPITDFFKSLAGQLAAALEAGILAVFKDLWDVIVGPLEILAGVIIVIIALGIAFRADVAGLVV
jgi:hypothetical protein